MSNYKSDFIREINQRGFIHQSTDLSAIDQKLSKSNVTAYIGFDATSDSLHIGSLVPLFLLSWLQFFGNKPIALLGGGTTMVGDPSGKDRTRNILKLEEINNNKNSIKKIFNKFINFKNNKALMLDNYNWLSKQNYIDFIRTVGTHLTINRMLTYDSVKLRLSRKQSLSFLEFNYMILQAYDFLYLNENYNCSLQMGGSDQWGNIINGVELVRRVNNKTVYGITSPLITTSTGLKMGKTSLGAVWLNKNKYSSYDFYQYWRNVDDKNVEKFLKLFTFLDLNEIKKLSKLKGSEINIAKKILAYEITKICRNDNEAKKAQTMAENTFEKNTPDKRLNSFTLKRKNFSNNKISIVDAMIKLNFINSRGEAKRLIKGGGVKINDSTVINVNTLIELIHFEKKDIASIACGKKKFGLIKLIN